MQNHDKTTGRDHDTSTLIAEQAGPPLPCGKWPMLPDEAPERSAENSQWLQQARRFHQGDPTPTAKLQKPGERFVPALLFPFRDPTTIRYDYPLLLFPPPLGTDGQLTQPLADLLKQWVEGFAPGPDDAKVLKDNLTRLERLLGQAMANTHAGVDADTTLVNAAQTMKKELALKGQNAQHLSDDLAKLCAAVPEHSQLLSLTPQTADYLFLHAARHHTQAARSALHQQVRQLRNRLRDLVRVGKAKAPGSQDPKTLGESVGAAGVTHIDPQALARVLGPVRGSQPMDAKRRQRLENALDVFEKYLAQSSPAVLTVVYGKPQKPQWDAPDVNACAVDPDQVCAIAIERFDQQAAEHARLFAMMRLARLELSDAYEPPRHGPLLKAFTWQSFTDEEFAALPPVLALESARHLASTGMADLSRLLLCGRTVQVIVGVEPATNPAQTAADELTADYRFELAYLGISHREAMVHQTSATRPDHLLGGFTRSLNATCASLHVVASGLDAQSKTPTIGSFLHTSAALEGRAHPFFHYDPEAGTSWAQRFDVTGNPQPEADWPVNDLTCQLPDGKEKTLRLAFTFADFALLEKPYQDCFGVLPAPCADEALIPIAHYLALNPQEATQHIPFIWAVDQTGQMQRLVVSRFLTFACRDRLDYWATLQELAGIGNEHVRAAVQRERERLEAQFAQQQHKADQAHALEVEQVRSEVASQALGSLAQALVKSDLTQLPAMSPGLSSAAAPVVTETTPQVADTVSDQPDKVEVEDEDEDEGPQEPWIASALCTTCNDCMAINAQLFVYNDSKQATIGDPGAGTYAQLVTAAEKCPAKCIHPGTPLNPNEPDLDNLIERAKPFR